MIGYGHTQGDSGKLYCNAGNAFTRAEVRNFVPRPGQAKTNKYNIKYRHIKIKNLINVSVVHKPVQSADLTSITRVHREQPV